MDLEFRTTFPLCLLTNNPDMSPWSSMPEFYLLSTTLTCPRFLLRPRGIFPRCQSHFSHFGARALTGTRFPFMRMDGISDFDFNAETLLTFILFRVLFFFVITDNILFVVFIFSLSETFFITGEEEGDLDFLILLEMEVSSSSLIKLQLHLVWLKLYSQCLMLPACFALIDWWNCGKDLYLYIHEHGLYFCCFLLVFFSCQGNFFFIVNFDEGRRKTFSLPAHSRFWIRPLCPIVSHPPFHKPPQRDVTILVMVHSILSLLSFFTLFKILSETNPKLLAAIYIMFNDCFLFIVNVKLLLWLNLSDCRATIKTIKDYSWFKLIGWEEGRKEHLTGLGPA